MASKKIRVRPRTKVEHRATGTRDVTGNKPSQPSRRGANPDLRSFICAIDDPFCTESFGAKVPDEYALPSEAATLRHRYTVSSITTGDYIVVTPHPSVGSLALSQNTTGPPTLSAVTGSSFNWPIDSVATKLNSVSVATPVTAPAFGATYSSFRVVGWGVRIKNTSKPTDVFGDFTVGVLPVGGSIPSSFYPLLDDQWSGGVATLKMVAPGNQWTEMAKFASLPTTAYYGTPATDNQRYGAPKLPGLDGLASFDNFTATEIAESGGILIKPKLHSPGEAWRFRPTSGHGVGGGLNSGVAVAYTAATQGSETKADAVSLDPSVMDVSGHNVVVVQFGPATGQTYEIEVVYHIEAIPIIATSGSNFNPVGMKSSPTVPRSILDGLITGLLKSPWVEFVKHEGSKLYGNAVQALPGLMSKTMMMALA